MALEVHRKPLTVYRLSMRLDGRSMWYDRAARFDPVDQVFADIPMPLDARQALHRERGGEWLSSTENLSLLRLWFPNMGGVLKKMGFVAHEVQVQEYAHLPNEVVFNRDTAVMQELDIDLERLLDTPRPV